MGKVHVRESFGNQKVVELSYAVGPDGVSGVTTYYPPNVKIDEGVAEIRKEFKPIGRSTIKIDKAKAPKGTKWSYEGGQ